MTAKVLHGSVDSIMKSLTGSEGAKEGVKEQWIKWISNAYVYLQLASSKLTK